MNRTSLLSDNYVIVHDKTNVLSKTHNVNQETVSINTIEVFGTELEMQDRIVELGLIDLPVEEEI
jgi:hypothetical protein